MVTTSERRRSLAPAQRDRLGGPGSLHFLNVPEPIDWDEWSHSNPLIIGDAGLINLFLKDDGTLRWTFHTN